jgi:hypothetical protein
VKLVNLVLDKGKKEMDKSKKKWIKVKKMDKG